VTRYQVLLLVILVAWPIVIMTTLFLMSRLETYVERSDASTPEEAGLEPVAGHSQDREVKIVFDGHTVGEPELAQEPASEHPI
jgi:hypothetical protein